MRTPLINWLNTAGVESSVYEMDTAEVIKLFLIKDPNNFHPELMTIFAFEGTADSLATMHVVADAQQARPGEREVAFVKIFPIYVLGEGSSIVNRNHMIVRDEASLSGQGARDRPLEPLPVRNSIHFGKTAGDTWNFVIDYILVRGGMDMTSELAELFSQIRQISPERSAGGIGFQPTDRFRQVGGLGAPDHGDG